MSATFTPVSSIPQKVTISENSSEADIINAEQNNARRQMMINFLVGEAKDVKNTSDHLSR